MKIRVNVAMAEQMLKANHPDQPHVDLPTVEHYRETLASRGPEWGLKKMPLLQVDDEGFLVNGQHHLLAIIHERDGRGAYMDLMAGSIR